MTPIAPRAAVAATLLALLGAGCGATVSGTSHGGPAMDTTARLAPPPSVASGTPAASPGGSLGTSPRCTAGQVTASVSTDHPAYRSGEPVVATTVLTNHSAQPCSLSVSARDPGFSVSGAGGDVWRTCGPGQSCPLYERLVDLPPGGHDSVSVTWDQDTCGASACGGPAPPAGAYRMSAAWSGLGSATAVFTLG